MKNLTSRLIDVAAESFPMRGPVFEFGFSPGCAGRAQPFGDDFEPDQPGAPTRIGRLADLDRLPFSDAEAKTVVCENALQYTFEPHRAIGEMTRILAPGGLLVVAETTGPTGADGSQRYWTIHPGALGRLLGGLDATLIGWIGPEAAPHTVFALGCKSPVPAEFARGVQPLLERIDRALAEVAPRRNIIGLIKRWLSGGGRPRRDEFRAQYALHLPIDEQSKPAILESCLPQTKTGTRLDLSE